MDKKYKLLMFILLAALAANVGANVFFVYKSQKFINEQMEILEGVNDLIKTSNLAIKGFDTVIGTLQGTSSIMKETTSMIKDENSKLKERVKKELGDFIKEKDAAKGIIKKEEIPDPDDGVKDVSEKLLDGVKKALM